MNRLAGLLALLVAGLAIGDAWGAAPPIVTGSSVPMTTAADATSTPTPVSPETGASLVLSNSRAGVRPVALTLELRYEMQCGNPGTGSLLVDLPSQMQVPSRFPSGSARLDGKSVALTFAARSELRIPLPPRPGILCDLIGPGTLTLVVTKQAGIGNPTAAGTYPVVARPASHTFRTTMRITAD